MKQTYVTVALQLIDAGFSVEQLVAALQKEMQKRGHEKLLLAVLKSVSNQLSASRATRTIVRVANEGDKAKYLAEIETILAAHNNSTDLEYVVDPLLVGGYQVEVANTRIDTSYKHTLIALYQNIITT